MRVEDVGKQESQAQERICAWCPNSDVENCFGTSADTLHSAAESIPRSAFIKHLKPYWNRHMMIRIIVNYIVSLDFCYRDRAHTRQL